MVTEMSFHRVKIGKGMKLSTHLHLSDKAKIGVPSAALSKMSSWCGAYLIEHRENEPVGIILNGGLVNQKG
jgi:hypothetical protein